MSQADCPKAFCSSAKYCARFRRCLFNGEPFKCAEACEVTWPHYHEVRIAPAGNMVQCIVYIPEDPNAEVRDPDTGEVIFPATKRPLRAITGSKK